MAYEAPLYLGFDLSTQQLKGVAVTSDLKVAYSAKFDFDADSHGFDIHKGVQTNEAEHAVFAPVALWLQALDSVLESFQRKGLDFQRIKGISGAGQQHGSVYWSFQGENVLQSLVPAMRLEEQLAQAFSHPVSPNWQDASTQKECDEFDAALGDAQTLATNTGSKAHHRFTGPQILRFRRREHEAYKKTSRISLVSSFLASIFLCKVAPIDISDACGMNLWDVKAGTWNQQLLTLASEGNSEELTTKIGPVLEDGGGSFGKIGTYFVDRYGFSPECSVAPFTGDNPATILALPLREQDAIVSLGTSTTFLMSTRSYKPHPDVHFMNHPTTPGLYMFMLCYKNGGLAREQVRDALNVSSSSPDKSWSKFDEVATSSPVLNQVDDIDPMKLGLFFPRPEIVPNIPAGTRRYFYFPQTHTLKSATSPDTKWSSPNDDARSIVESQFLSLRLRSADLVAPPSPNQGDFPAQPRRIYLVGGGSQNLAIAKIAGEVLGGIEGVYKLDVGENACALGAAYKAVWSTERKKGETFENFVGGRWNEDDFVERLGEGYQKGTWERYGDAVKGLKMVEERAEAEERGFSEK